MSLIILFITSLFAFWDLEDPEVVSPGKQAVGFFQSLHLKDHQRAFTELSACRAESWSAAQGSVYLKIFRNTLNFFKPLPSGKMSGYYRGSG